MTTPLLLAGWAGGAMLLAGAAAAVWRIVRGPSLMDRAVATDVLLVMLGGGLVLDMAVRRHTHSIVLVLLTAAVGFLGTVMVARFVEERRPEHAQEDQALVPGTTDVVGAEEEG